MTKPITKTSWSNGTPENRIEPGNSKKNTGFLADERPGFQHFNWLIWILEQWVNYLENTTDLLIANLEIEKTERIPDINAEKDARILAITTEQNARIDAINSLINKLAGITYDPANNQYIFTAEIVANVNQLILGNDTFARTMLKILAANQSVAGISLRGNWSGATGADIFYDGASYETIFASIWQNSIRESFRIGSDGSFRIIGIGMAPTPDTADNSTKIATTAYVKANTPPATRTIFNYSAKNPLGFNTVYQAAEDGFVFVKLGGSYMNGAQLQYGTTNNPQDVIAYWGDDINSNTKQVAASFPIQKGVFFRLAPYGSWVFEAIELYWYPVIKN